MALVLWLFSKDILSSIFIWGYIVEASYIKFLMINDIQCTKVNTGSREYLSTRKSSCFSKIKSSSSSKNKSFDIYCIKYFLSDLFYLFELKLLQDPSKVQWCSWAWRWCSLKWLRAEPGYELSADITLALSHAAHLDYVNYVTISLDCHHEPAGESFSLRLILVWQISP